MHTPACIVTAFAPSSLAERIAEAGETPLLESDAMFTVAVGHQIAQALNFLHLHHLVHGCLWPQNVMLMPPDAEHNRTNRVKLSDYGRPRRMIRLLVERESEEEALALAESGEEALYDDGKMLPYIRKLEIR